MSYRMVAYLCEVKSLLRAQNQAVDELNADLARATRLCAPSTGLWTNWQQRWSGAGVGKVRRGRWRGLRDHCAKVHAAYETMSFLPLSKPDATTSQTGTTPALRGRE